MVLYSEAHNFLGTKPIVTIQTVLKSSMEESRATIKRYRDRGRSKANLITPVISHATSVICWRFSKFKVRRQEKRVRFKMWAHAFSVPPHLRWLASKCPENREKTETEQRGLEIEADQKPMVDLILFQRHVPKLAKPCDEMGHNESGHFR